MLIIALRKKCKVAKSNIRLFIFNVIQIKTTTLTFISGYENEVQCRKSVSHSISRISCLPSFSGHIQPCRLRRHVSGRSFQVDLYAEAILHLHRSHFRSPRRLMVQKLFHIVVLNGQNCQTMAHFQEGMSLLFSTYRFRYRHCLSSAGRSIFPERIVRRQIKIVEYS